MPRASLCLVEDEALTRLMIIEMLQELGHQVVAEVGSIQEAKPLARMATFDLAILDINIATPRFVRRGKKMSRCSRITVRRMIATLSS